MKRRFGLLMLPMILLSGCLDIEEVRPDEMQRWERPDTEMFRDDFSVGFMKSILDQNGLYMLESGSDEFEMLVHGEYRLFEESYYLADDLGRERMEFQRKHDNGTRSTILLTYGAIQGSGWQQELEQTIINDGGVPGEFEETDADWSERYIAEVTPRKIEEYEWYGLVAYVKSTEDGRGIEMVTKTVCESVEGAACEKAAAESNDEIRTMIHSITFKRLNRTTPGNTSPGA